jgi:hypothetical protein
VTGTTADAELLLTLTGVVLILGAVKAACPPDEYCAAVLVRAALNVFNVGILTGDLMLLIVARSWRTAWLV